MHFVFSLTYFRTDERLAVRPSVHPSVRPSVRQSVRPSVRLSVRPSVRPVVRPSFRSYPTTCGTLLLISDKVLKECKAEVPDINDCSPNKKNLGFAEPQWFASSEE